MKKSRHEDYQNFKDQKYQRNNNINLDQIRFEWVKKILGKKYIIKTLTDIGSNLGYICVKFNETFNTKCIGYEYERPTFLKANKIKKNLKNIKYVNKGLNIKNLNNIGDADLMVNLNVLHHAGHMYDKKIISSNKEWKNYAIKYLKILSKKSKYLFFQTGNVNYNKNYFKNSETFEILPYILKNSGWKIIKIGSIKFLKKNIYYKTYKNNQIKKIPNIICKRDKKTKKVLYFINKKLIFKYESGFLQRPLFLCKSKNI